MALAKSYAETIDRLIRESGKEGRAGRGMPEKDVFEKLRAHLAATGRLKLLPQIARELRMIAAHRATEAPMLEAASSADAKAAEAASRAQGIEATAQLNPNLIRGWRLRANGSLNDRSAKRSLIELYRKITT